MKVVFEPQLSEADLSVHTDGDTLIVNGTAFDLSPLADGERVWFGAGRAVRTNGELTVTLPLPYLDAADIDPMQVYEVEVAEDGPVTVPGHDAQQPAEIVEGVIEWPEPEPELSQREKDELRYQRRAAVKDQLLAYMAADNMSRVRDGVWSVADLTSLMDDPAVVAANAYMATLSFELAAQAIMSAATPLLTPEIKAAWVGKLQEHYYLEA